MEHDVVIKQESARLPQVCRITPHEHHCSTHPKAESKVQFVLVLVESNHGWVGGVQT
jgi:hypothetical protein